VPPFGRDRFGAIVWVLTVWVPGHLGAETFGHRRLGVGRFGTVLL